MMRRFQAALVVSIFLYSSALNGCGVSHGGAGNILPQAFWPSAAASAPTRIWTYECACGDPARNLAIRTWDPASGMLLHSVLFSSSVQGVGPFLVTSPNQAHVYATIVRFNAFAIADIKPVDYSVRYYQTQLLANDSRITGFLISPDGEFIYLSVYSRATNQALLYTVSTITRVIAPPTALPYPASIQAISQDGRTLFGSYNSGAAWALVAIDTRSHYIKTFNSGGLQGEMVLSPSYLYVASSILQIFSAVNTGHVASIRPPDPSIAFQSVTIDNGLHTLYLTTEFPDLVSGTIFGLDTSSNRITETSSTAFIDLSFFMADPVTHRLYYGDAGTLCWSDPPNLGEAGCNESVLTQWTAAVTTVN